MDTSRSSTQMMLGKSVIVLLAIVHLREGSAQVAGLTPADTVQSDFAGVPQLAFPPQPVFAASADPRRQLSLQQQTHILTDIQQHHHRFFQQAQPQQPLQQLAQPQASPPSAPAQQPQQPQQPLLYSQLTQLGAPTGPRETEPIFQPQPGQFVRIHALAAAPPTAPTAGEAAPSAPSAPSAPPAQQHTFSAHRPLVRAQSVLFSHQLPPSAAATASAAQPSNSLQAPNSHLRPRGRSENGNFAHQSIFLQDERQKLFEQIREQQQQQQEQQQQQQQQKQQQQQQQQQQHTFQHLFPSFQQERSIDRPLPPPSDVDKPPASRATPPPSPLREQQQQQLLQAQLQKQFQLQLQQRQELIRQLKAALATTPAPTHRDQVLPHPSAPGISLGNSSGPLFLANGQQLKIFESALEQNTVSARSTTAAPRPAPTPSPTNPPVAPTPRPTSPTAPVKAPKALFDELTKGVLPPGAQFEVIRHKQDGGLEELGKLPPNLPNKKVTFVFLEEQPDGTVKVQGVRANDAAPTVNKTSSPVDIDSILKRIQEGDIKLPPSTKLQTGTPKAETTPQESIQSPTFLTKATDEGSVSSPRPNSVLPTVNPSSDDFLSKLSDNAVSLPFPVDMDFFPSVSISGPDDIAASNPYFGGKDYQESTSPSTTKPPKPSSNSESLFISSPSSQPAYNTRNSIQSIGGGAPQPAKPSQDPPRVAAPPVNRPTSPPRAASSTPRVHFSPTPVTTAAPPVLIGSSAAPPVAVTTLRSTVRPTSRATSSTQSPRVAFPGSEPASSNGSAARAEAGAAPAGVLSQVLKKEGLFAMAKFLKDSGLDSILNDTGPYTIFIPTDKAFRSLLVQLGGPDKAEIKFRENPRLLSGLLLHHVIPGSFKLDDLQDEMTGVSLAGTQLRVNTYFTQDAHWNDVQVTTINGARVVRGQHDIAVPQGVAHALDRVMFPLPVGDLLQTLAADRERRFTRLLRLVRVAGLESLLSGARTHTLLAPTDKALSALPAGELQRALKDAGRARALLQRHLVAGALYGAGLRFYQERPSLAAGRPVALAKADGQLKANNAHVLTPNIPATNGVLHVIDSVL